MRILFASSTRFPWFESQDPEFHLQKAPYSINAIGCHLARRGHTIAWAGWNVTASPRRLARFIDDFQPTIIYTYGAATALTPLLARRLFCRHKAFRVIHGWDDAYGDIWGNLAGWPGRLAMNLLERHIICRSDGVVTLSRYLQQRGRRWGVECHYIPNGADPVDSLDTHGSITLTGRFNLVYTGDKARWKRTADVCEAMRHLPPDIKLYLTGQDEPYLREFASPNCVFLGFLPKNEQLHVMSQAHAFVVTADQDCNAKLHEYLRWHKPILGYDGRANLFFQNHHNALLTRDYPAAIQRLASDPNLCAHLVQNARAELPVLSWAEIAALFEDYFAS